jgi:hypothetical protein
VTFTATTALPYPHFERATAGLRAELRHQLLTAGVTGTPDWSTLTVTGPEEFTDRNGNLWFGYWATLDSP